MPAQSITFSYFPDGSRSAMTTPAGVYSYGYDAVGRQNSLTNPYSETTTWSYKDNGWMAAQQQPSPGATTTYSFNGLGEITDVSNSLTAGGALLSEFGTIQYDGVGNCVSLSTNIPGAPSAYSGTLNLGYDSRDELTQEQSTLNGGFTNNFVYDAAGNPTTLRSVNGNSYNADNQIALAGYQYDGNRNPTTFRGTSLTFDPENHVTVYGSALTAGYNGDGQRAWKQSTSGRTYFIYAGFQLVCELDGSGNLVAANTFGANGLLSRHTATGSVFYSFDQRGNVSQRLSSTGILATYSFDAFGRRTGTDNTTDPFAGFEGQRGYYTDAETGLSLAGDRSYDPTTARFLNRDPLDYNGGVNLYSYAGSNSIVRCDPLGLSWWGDNPIGAIATAAAACGLSAILTDVAYFGDSGTCDPEKRCNEIVSCAAAIVGALVSVATFEVAGPFAGCIGAAAGGVLGALGQYLCHRSTCGSNGPGNWGCYLVNEGVSAIAGCVGSFLPGPVESDAGAQAGGAIQNFLIGPLSNVLGSAFGNGCSAASDLS